MSVSRKFKVCYITFLLLASTFSVFIISNNALAEDDPLGLSEGFGMFDDILKELYPEVILPHPYRFVSEYYYDGSDPIEINGDIVFQLYFSSTVLTQLELLDFRDSINVSIYSIDSKELESPDSIKINAHKLENANATVTLKPKLLEDAIQGITVTLKNINHTLNTGDFLIFSIEIMQSKKPIGDFIENRYDRHTKPFLEKVAKWLNESEDPDLASIGGVINDTLASIEDAGITTDEIAELGNSLRSSAFVYDSASYPSSANISINTNESLEIYFHNSISYDLDLGFGQVKTANETKSSSDAYSMWPPFSLDSLDSISEEYMEESEWMNWLIIWLMYSTSDNGATNENQVIYYLTSENKLDSSGPEDGKKSVKLSTDPLTWEGPTLERNKIIKSAKADLYAYYPKILTLGKATITAQLLDNNVTIGEPVEKELNRTGALELLQGGPNQATIFDFSIPDDMNEIMYGHSLNLEISVNKKPLLSLRKTKLACGNEFPSSLVVEFEETTNINMTIEDAESEKYVIPGGSAEYLLNITSSKYADTITIDVIEDIPFTDESDSDYDSNWDIDYQKSITIEEGGYELVKVTVTSTDDSVLADGDKIDLTFVATGKTGIDLKEGTVEVSEKAVEYDTVITVEPLKQEIKHGESAVYYFTFKNNNTGIWPDNYKINATSEHDWDIDISYESGALNSVDVGDEVNVNVTLHIPAYTDITSDKLTFTVISRSKQVSTTMNVTTTIIAPNALEQFYHFFESLAEDIGLDDTLGNFAAVFLMILLFVPLLIMFLVIILILRRRHVDVICLERIKDITPDENARFEITIRNPTKNTKTYDITLENDPSPEGLDATINKKTVVVDAKQEEVVNLDVTPNDLVKADDWAEVTVSVNAIGRKKSAKISTVTTIVGAEKDLRIYGVFHWPRVFKKGSKVETSFKLENKGNVSANNVTVVLLVNGEEKNKIEDINIPRGGYAEMEIPWIAVKGKNDVDIVVK